MKRMEYKKKLKFLIKKMHLLQGSTLKLKVINTDNFIQLHSYTIIKHKKTSFSVERLLHF